MIRLENVTFGYSRENLLLDDLSLAFPPGKISVILGRNGAGKTTLLQCMYGMLKPEKGRIWLDDIDIVRLTSKQIARKVAVVRQEAHYIFPYTVMDIVLMGRTPHLSFLNTPSPKDLQKAKDALDMVGMSSFAERRIQELSSGEVQMVLLARALCQSPQILLLDEANAHLDLYNQYHMLHLVSCLCKENKMSVIAVIHLPEIAYWFSDYIVMLEKGKVLFSGDTKKVMTDENLSAVYKLPMKMHRIDERHIAISLESYEIRGKKIF